MRFTWQQPSLWSWFTESTKAALEPRSHDSMVTVPRLARWWNCCWKLSLHECLHLAGTNTALLRPPRISHCCSALEDCGKEWRHSAPPVDSVCGIVLMCRHFMFANGLNWCVCGGRWCVLPQGVLCMHVTSLLLQYWLEWWVLSYWSKFSLLWMCEHLWKHKSL